MINIRILLLLSCLKVADSAWKATGNLRQIWATPVMEYRGLFSKEQLQQFSKEVQDKYADFLKEREDPSTPRRSIKPEAEHSSTPNDKDRMNEEFFNYQSRNPLSHPTLETIWQAFCFAVSKYVKESGLPDIEYQRPNAIGTALEWTKGGTPIRGKQYCWGSVQSRGMHHDIHTHPGAAVAGTIYLKVPDDGGALTLSDPRGPLPPFNYAYRIAPEDGLMVLFPATLPHGVHSTPGHLPRVSISCNFPGDWKKFTTSKVVWNETTWSHDMMSREEAMAARKNEL